MHERPVIGVPIQTLQVLEGLPRHVPDSWVTPQRYARAISDLGALPWLIPLLEEDPVTLREIYERVDGLFLAGGVDIHPEAYCHEYRRLCGRTDRPRDEVELLLTRWAIEDAKPVFGACRGIQLINVAAGGTLYQDVSAQRPGSLRHDYFPRFGYARDYLAHEVSIRPESRLEAILGPGSLKVNSMHHQAVLDLAPGLVATAHADDGLIEAIEGAGDHFLVGVQWHPEVLVGADEGTRRLFGEFIREAARFRQEGRRHPPLNEERLAS
jgi:putative glutamine amidotransferase